MLARDDNFSIPVEPHQSSAGELSVSDVRWILRRGWLLPVLGSVIGLALAVTFLVLMPQLYLSSARILLDRSENRFLQTNKILDEPSLDDIDMAGQIYVLSSDSVIVPVIRSMNLTHDPEFVGRSFAHAEEGDVNPCARSFSGPCFSYSVKNLKDIVLKLIGWKVQAAIDPNTLLERTAVETFLRRLSVERGDVTNIINITFSSEDPNKAAAIANAIADAYISTTGERKLKSNKLVSQLLEDRLMDLEQQSINGDRALQEFKTANNLIGVVAPENSLISRLRSEYVDLARKINELEGAVGPAHLAVVKLRKQMDGLNAVIRDEEERAGGSDGLKTATRDLDGPAEARNDEISANLAKFDGEKQTKYRELEIAARTSWALYNSDLRKFNELSQTQPDTEDAHIIARAAPPLHKNPKKSLLVIGGGIAFGLLSGIGAALVREWAADVFRTPEQVKRATGIYCTILPTVQSTKSGGLADYVIDAPRSRFTETFRNIRALIEASQRANGGKVICIVSSVSQEGKTTVANNLAALMSASSTSRTLLIDCDLHRRKVTANLAPDASEGLIEALGDPSRLAKLVSKRERAWADVLPCAPSERPPNIAELLGSTQMGKLLDAAREAYDIVLIEIAPIMSVVDVKMIERFIDRFVFVIEWGQTKRRLVQEALSEAEIIRDRVMCIVLNKADPAA
jgi:polysaccharide biosynthesis transport protein